MRQQGFWVYTTGPAYPTAAPAAAVQPVPPPPTLPSAPGGLAQPTTPPMAPGPVGQALPEMQSDPGYAGDDPAYGAGPAAGGCGLGGLCCPTGRPCLWYGSASVLAMSRNRANMLWTTYRASDESDQMDEYGWEWGLGGEIRFGRRFCRCCDPCCETGCEYDECCDYGDPGGAYAVPRGIGGFGGYGLSNWALEATCWLQEPFTSYMSLTHEDGVSTPLIFNVGNVAFGGTAASSWFDGADEHRVWRRSVVQSIELSLVHSQFYLPTRMPLTIDWSLGVRYFRFDDRLTFGSLRNGGSWDNGADTAFLEDEIANNLIGFQAGLEAEYYVGPRFRFFFTPKFGIYNNHILNDFRLNLGNGTVATQQMYPGQSYPVESSENVVSFLTQIDLGMRWNFARNWSAHVGYRLVVATAMGLADDQIPTYIADIPEIQSIDHNAELILHGGFVGVAYNF
jgi:hypothetical protein